jgi:hypothetical protein
MRRRYIKENSEMIIFRKWCVYDCSPQRSTQTRAILKFVAHVRLRTTTSVPLVTSLTSRG